MVSSMRTNNVSVVCGPQARAGIRLSAIAPALVDSCPRRSFLPSPQALGPQLRSVYESFGLNARQIELIAHAQPKRDYYYQSRAGNRLFDLDLGPVAPAFTGAPTPAGQRKIGRAHV